ncbi:hypothetical protein ANCCAN_23352, partial [Ancylostoma caninum]
LLTGLVHPGCRPVSSTRIAFVYLSFYFYLYIDGLPQIDVVNFSKFRQCLPTTMSGCDSGEGSSQSEPSQFEWELCRENVKPLKSGRRVEAINQALAHAAYGPKAETLANQKFDEIMELCEASHDPLKHCLDFCTWFEQTFPHGRQRLFYSLLWKIVHKYAKWPAYLEDERMVRIWEKLADNSLGHGWEIYQHANSIGSLLRLVFFSF